MIQSLIVSLLIVTIAVITFLIGVDSIVRSYNINPAIDKKIYRRGPMLKTISLFNVYKVYGRAGP